jgi:hypothetical protein
MCKRVTAPVRQSGRLDTKPHRHQGAGRLQVKMKRRHAVTHSKLAWLAKQTLGRENKGHFSAVTVTAPPLPWSPFGPSLQLFPLVVFRGSLASLPTVPPLLSSTGQWITVESWWSAREQAAETLLLKTLPADGGSQAALSASSALYRGEPGPRLWELGYTDQG